MAAVLAAAPMALAALHTVGAAVRLGSRADTVERQSDLARAILRDHVCCFAAIVVLLSLQLAFGR